MKSLIVIGLLLAAPAHALDGRLSTRLYDPGAIVVVHGRTGIQSTIEFGSDEKIENIAVGDSTSWQVTPNKRASIVFVKPMLAPARTNMTVVTDRRTYLFDLVSRGRETPLYILRFAYPPEPKPAVVAVVTPAEAITPPEPKPPVPTPADLDFAWTTAGAKQLLPVRVFDDGKSTWLAWGKDATLPAILMRGPAGEEGPVDYRVQGDYVIVDGVPPQLLLRQGKLIATLTPSPRPAKPVAEPSAASPDHPAQTASRAQ